MDIGVLTGVTAALVYFAIRGAYSVWMRRMPDGDRNWRIGVTAALTVAAITCGYFEASFHHRQQLASDALRVIATFNNVSANCARIAEEMFNLGTFDGYVYFDGSNVAHLRRHVCIDLASYAAGGHLNPTEDEMLAVHILSLIHI